MNQSEVMIHFKLICVYMRKWNTELWCLMNEGVTCCHPPVGHLTPNTNIWFLLIKDVTCCHPPVGHITFIKSFTNIDWSDIIISTSQFKKWSKTEI